MEVKDEGRELQEKLVLYRVLEEKLNGLMNQQGGCANKILELQRSIETIDEMVSGSADVGKELLFPIGSSSYMKGSAADMKKVIVEVGSDVAIEMGIADGRKMLESQMKELQEAMPNFQKEIESISRTMQEIESQAQEMYQKSQPDMSG
jgi:prefoldin alpha subunit